MESSNKSKPKQANLFTFWANVNTKKIQSVIPNQQQEPSVLQENLPKNKMIEENPRISSNQVKKDSSLCEVANQKVESNKRQSYNNGPNHTENGTNNLIVEKDETKSVPPKKRLKKVCVNSSEDEEEYFEINKDAKQTTKNQKTKKIDEDYQSNEEKSDDDCDFGDNDDSDSQGDSFVASDSVDKGWGGGRSKKNDSANRQTTRVAGSKQSKKGNGRSRSNTRGGNKRNGKSDVGVLGTAAIKVQNQGNLKLIFLIKNGGSGDWWKRGILCRNF